ncbi:MAG: right-handed parallel beta-helix repeat-containing protein [Phycisphaeraceae bacterium JB051]
MQQYLKQFVSSKPLLRGLFCMLIALCLTTLSEAQVTITSQSSARPLVSQTINATDIASLKTMSQGLVDGQVLYDSSQQAWTYDYAFDQDPSWLIKDMTPLCQEALKQLTADHALHLTATSDAANLLVVQLHSAQGKWFQATCQLDGEGKQQIILPINRRTFSFPWGPAEISQPTAPFDAIRIGVKGNGKGQIKLSELRFAPTMLDAQLENTHQPKAINLDHLQQIKTPLITGGGNRQISINVADFGAQPNDGINDTLAIRQAIAEARRQHAGQLVFQTGTYNIGTVANPDLPDQPDRRGIILDDLKNITIQGNEALLLTEPYVNTIWVEQSRNLRIENLSIDNTKPPFIQGNITAISDDGHTLDIKLEPGFEVDGSESVTMMMRFDSTTRLTDINEPMITEPGRIFKDGKFTRDECPIIKVDDNHVRITNNGNMHGFNKLHVGDLLLIRHGSYKYNGIMAFTTRNFAVQNVNIYSAYGMGMWANDCANIHVENLKIHRKPNTNRLLSVSADALHFKECSGKIIVNNSTMMHQLDDCLNIKGRYHHLVQFIDSKRVLIRMQRNNSEIPFAGERLGLFTQGGAQIGAVTLSRVLAGKEFLYYEIQFDQPVDKQIQSRVHVLASLVRTPSEVLVTNCTMGENRGRGMLIQARNVRIANNTIKRTSSHGIWALTDPDQWGEALPPKNLVIENNTVIDSPYVWKGASIRLSLFRSQFKPGEYAFGKIVIRNNQITKNKTRLLGEAISAYSVDSMQISNNSIDIAPNMLSPNQRHPAVSLTNARHVQIDKLKTNDGMMLIDQTSELSTISGNVDCPIQIMPDLSQTRLK